MIPFLKKHCRRLKSRIGASWFRQECERDPYRVTFWLFHALYVSSTAAALTERDIPDLLADGPKTADELAKGSGLRADRLNRALRAMASLGLFTRDAQDRYGLTPYTRLLCADAPDSLKPWALMCGKLTLPDLPHIPACLERGENVYEAGHGAPVWEYLTRNPDLGGVFDRAMASFTHQHVDAILAACDFSRYGSLVDVGGGRGALLSGILKKHPGLRGVLIDRALVVEQAREVMAAAGVLERCQLIAGDFLQPLPQTGDVFVIKHVLHDWDDENAARILRNIANAIDAGRELLIIEGVIRENGDPADIFRTWWDLAQMYHTRGGERTHGDWLRLLAASGLELVDITDTRLADVSILRTRKARA